jgi:hypothetical protein
MSFYSLNQKPIFYCNRGGGVKRRQNLVRIMHKRIYAQSGPGYSTINPVMPMRSALIVLFH